MNNRFHELDLLEKIENLVKEDGVILDIGANIGNHTLFFCNILKAKKVYSFEPQKYIYTLLERNVNINSLQDRVELFNIGLGDVRLNCNIKTPPKRLLRLNLGCTHLIDTEDGDVEVFPLDTLGIDEKIDFIKMDTEGFENKILKGAINLIKRDRPIVWVEIKDKNLDFVMNYFKELGYNDPTQISKEDFIFTPFINKASLEVKE